MIKKNELTEKINKMKELKAQKVAEEEPPIKQFKIENVEKQIECHSS